MRTSSSIVLVLTALAVGVHCGGALAKVPPCPGGRYLVAGHALAGAAAQPGMDVVDVAGRMVSVASGCDPTKARVRATAAGTKVHALWKSCEGITGKIVMSGMIGDYCRTFTGTFVAKSAHIVTPFLANLSACGDGIWDPDGGEECDAGLGPCGGLCNACSCVGVTTTTVTATTSPTTSVPGGSTTTTPTSPTTSTTGAGGGTTTSTSATPTTTPGSTTTHPAGTTTSSSTMPALPTTTSTSTTLPGPDLVPWDWMSASSAPAGTNTAVQFTVRNVGTATATAPWYDYILFSNDLALGNDTAAAVVQRTTDLAPNSQYTVLTNAAIPKVPPGTYYLFMQTDGSNAVVESNDANNVGSFVQLTVTAPDLIPTAFTAPSSATAGSTISVSYTVKDQGSANAVAPWSDRVVFSTDGTLDAGDTTIGTFAHATSLAVNGTYSATQMVTLPSVAPGTYRLFFQTDDGDAVYEGGQEANNVRGPLTITIN